MEIVLIPEIESFSFVWSLTVCGSTTETKYVASVESPDNACFPKVRYIILSPFLNLWCVENPILPTEEDAEPIPIEPIPVELKVTSWGTTDNFASATAFLVGLPPEIFTLGTSR